MIDTPENQARQKIDALLTAAGWIIQNRSDLHLGAGRGIAVREFPLKTGFADYLLYVDRQPVGAIEAKKEGVTLSGVEAQSSKYSIGLPDDLPAPFRPLPFLYESTGVETYFTNTLDPDSRSRRVFSFHRPETLAEWITEGTQTLRYRVRHYPPLIETGLWQAQSTAIKNLESSLAENRPRALIQMATGAGKTYTAVNFIYRMLQHGKFRRVLFLVDRTNLAKQALGEFQNFVTPDDGRKFTEIYNVQRLSSNTLDDVAKVTITTIQRLYSMLKGDTEFDGTQEAGSMWEDPEADSGDPRVVTYNPNIPIEYFDAIIVDECHRSIYSVWRQVLEYFDSFIIGLTATPSKQTFGFFNQNLVMEYTRADAVIDGVNVDSRLYRIRTRITQSGSMVEASAYVPTRDRRTRETRMAQLDQDFDYDADDLDHKVVAPDQIRTVIRTFRDRLFTEIFPGRTIVPKTLIFAKDDSHAEDIVRIVREEFGQGNDFCKKITYKVTGVSPEDLIAEFRNSYNPRIVVSVDMIGTGTDIKPLECLLFMRAVKSPGLFEQMQGRGTRVIDPTDLQVVTSDAQQKDHFVIVDAVGVMDIPKAETPTLERKPSVPLPKLLEQLAQGRMDDDLLITLAGRLARLDKKLNPNDRLNVEARSGGLTLKDLSRRLLDATTLDVQIEAAREANGGQEPTPAQIDTAAQQLKIAISDVFAPPLRTLLIDLHQRDVILIDELSQDQVLEAAYVPMDADAAAQTVQTFQAFIEENRDEITALQILYNIPYGGQQLKWAHIKELGQRLEAPDYRLNPDKLWAAYASVDPEHVRMAGTKRALTDLVALVRHAVQANGDLVPFQEQVNTRYDDWLAEQQAAGRRFTPQQRAWLDAIATHIGLNLALDTQEFDSTFYDRGGVQAALRVFEGPDQLRSIIDELNSRLAA